MPASACSASAHRGRQRLAAEQAARAAPLVRDRRAGSASASRSSASSVDQPVARANSSSASRPASPARRAERTIGHHAELLQRVGEVAAARSSAGARPSATRSRAAWSTSLPPKMLPHQARPWRRRRSTRRWRPGAAPRLACAARAATREQLVARAAAASARGPRAGLRAGSRSVGQGLGRGASHGHQRTPVPAVRRRRLERLEVGEEPVDDPALTRRRPRGSRPRCGRRARWPGCRPRRAAR